MLFYLFLSFPVDSSLDGSFLESDDSYHIPQEYYDALGTRPALPEYEFSKDFDPAIGMSNLLCIA